MQLEERFSDHEEALRSALEGHQATIHTNAPGIIVSYNPATGTAVVQPAVKGMITAADGSISYKDYPQLLDVPIHFPSGGGATMTFPIKKGDECLINFGSRDMSAWFQSGGTQAPIDSRMHDLSDAFATVGIRSKPRALANVSTSTVQLRSDAGETVLELDPTGHKINVTVPGGLACLGNVSVTGNMVVTGDMTIGGIGFLGHKHTDSDGVSSPPHN